VCCLESDNLSSASELFDIDKSDHLWNRIEDDVNQLDIHQKFEQISRDHRNCLEVLAVGKDF
jgi:hypothetical protein